jgi:hypothetical protein
LATCKDIIEKHGGTVNKYLGDGILAYWPHEEGTAKNIATVIAALKQAQTRGPDFRFVMHFGSVAIGGVSAIREETLMGSEAISCFASRNCWHHCVNRAESAMQRTRSSKGFSRREHWATSN